MPLPGDVSTFTLTFGPYTDAAGYTQLAGTTGKLTPVDANGVPVTVLHAGDGSVIVPAQILVTIGSDGTESITGLAHTDDTHLSPSPFLYQMTWDAPAYRSLLKNKLFAVPTASGASVDFDLLANGTTTTGVAINLPSVISVGGNTGAVTSAQIATALDTDGTRLSDASLKAAIDAEIATHATSSLVTITQQTGLTYTLVLADAATDIELTNTQTETVTVPPNSSVAFPVGTTLAVRQMGAGYVNVVAGAGVTLRAPNGARTSTQYSTVYLLKRATNEWVVSGDTSSALAPPNAPTIGTATAGQQSAIVAFTPVGAAATSYTATSTPGGFTATGSGSPITVPGLTAGTAYTFTVHATNTGGSSAESAASNSVTPTAPPAPSIPTTNMLAWFDASTISGVADGAAVASWLDVSPGAAHPLSQASSGNQPKLRSTSAVVALPNGKPVVDFDGFTQWMASVTHGLTTATFTVFWVATSPSPGKTETLIAYGSSDSAFVNSGNAWCIYCGTTLTSSALLTGTYNQLTGVYNGASSVVRRNAVQVASGNAGTTIPDTGFGYVMGANPGGTTGFFKGQIAEVIVYTGTLSGADQTTVESYLKTKYATP